MSARTINLAKARELTESERNFLKQNTGRDYTAVVPGTPGDGRVGLVGADAVDLIEIEPAKQVDAGVVDEFLQLVGIAEADTPQRTALLSHTDMNGQKPERRLRMGPSLERFFAEHDAQRGSQIEVIPRDEPAPEQAKRLEAFKNLASSMTPEMSERILTADFRHISPFVFGYTQEKIQYLRLGRVDLCEETGYHETAHLLTAYLEEKDPSFRREWDAIAGDTYIRGCYGYNDHPYEDEGALLAAGLISGYGAEDYHEDISELVSAVYTEPYRVKAAMAYSPIFRQKIDFLYNHHYFREDHYQYLTDNGPYPEVRQPDCA